jgi:hypothetical protein
MRRGLAIGLLALLTSAGSTGCFLNMYSSDPIRRYRQLFYQSEDLRLIEDDIERFWMIDQPSNLSFQRYNGFAFPNARTRF